jgi:ABC-type polysaccharide/polyol phosphate export permease
MHFLQTLGIFWTLTRRDIARTLNVLPADILNQISARGSRLLIFTYVTPQLGLPAVYPIIVLASSMVTCAVFKSRVAAGDLLGDITGEMKIGYRLRLPAPSWVIISQVALGYAIRTFTNSLIIILIGVAILRSKLPLTLFGCGKMLLLMLPHTLMFGFIAVWMAARTEEQYKIQNTFGRYIFPVWGIMFFAPWKLLMQQLPIIGWGILASPITYSMEGMRAALVGQEGFLNYWLCFGMLCGFTVIIGWRAVVIMKRRLDFV